MADAGSRLTTRRGAPCLSLTVDPDNNPTAGDLGPTGAELELAGDAPLMRGLRRTGDEAQLTQVIGRLAATSERFASGYANVLLIAAARRFPERVGLLGRVPPDLQCAAEYTLSRQEGRVDLRLHAPGFTLLVEHKLHSDFGYRQLDRYRAAIDRLPRGSHALVAVTRNVPTPSALELTDSSRWLGVVRWRALLDGLRRLRHDDDRATNQWRTLLQIIDEQGDFGVGQLDQRDLETWGRFSAARARFVDILDEARVSAEDTLRRQLRDQRYTTSDHLLSLVTHKRTGKTAIKVAQQEAWVGWALPAGGDVVVSFGFAANSRASTTDFNVVVWPRDLTVRYEQDDATQRAVRELEKHGFNYSAGGSLRRVHRPAEWAAADDVVATLVDVFAADVTAVIASGILKPQYEQARKRRRLKRRS